MNIDELSKQFDQRQATRQSPYEEQFTQFLDEKLENANLKETMGAVILHCVETRRQMKDYIEGNSPGMYD